MLANNTTNGSHSGQCDAANLIAIAGWIVFGVGVVSNSLLLYFVLKKLAAGKRNDKLFLLNIIVANFFSLFGSLFEEVLSRGKTFPLVKNYCLVFHQVNFTSLYINLTSMAALFFDRYENVTKFPGQRKLSFGKSVKIVVVGWAAVAFVLVLCGESLFFVTDSQGNGICKDSKKILSPIEVAGFIFFIAVTTAWITVHASVMRLSLFAIFSRLKQHRQETEQVHGVTKAVKMVNQKIQAVAMVICYYSRVDGSQCGFVPFLFLFRLSRRSSRQRCKHSSCLPVPDYGQTFSI